METSQMRATWNGVVLAESDKTILLEGNHYFPSNSLKHEYFTNSTTHTRCPWKGEASYFNIEVGNQTNPDAAWYYPEPSVAAANIKSHVAFWRGVVIEQVT